MYRSFTINAQFLIKKRRKLIYTPNSKDKKIFIMASSYELNKFKTLMSLSLSHLPPNVQYKMEFYTALLEEPAFERTALP